MNALELEAFASGKKEMPDFGQYVHSRTLRFDEARLERGDLQLGHMHVRTALYFALLRFGCRFEGFGDSD